MRTTLRTLLWTAAWLLALLLTFTVAARAEEKPSMLPVHATWEISTAALIASHALDSASSWGRPEANPLMGRTFGPRGLGVKVAAVGGLVLVEHRTIRRYPGARRRFAVFNLVCTAAVSAVAIRNWVVAKSGPALQPGVGL